MGSQSITPARPLSLKLLVCNSLFLVLSSILKASHITLPISTQGKREDTFTREDEEVYKSLKLVICMQLDVCILM